MTVQNYYNSLEPIFCEAIHDFVGFNSTGYKHIKYRGSGAIRAKKQQALRMSILPIAVKLIGLTTTYQELEKSTKEVTINIHEVEKTYTKKITYWGLIAIIDNHKIKVILRKIGNGKIHFFSVIPNWNTSPKRDKYLFKH